VDDHGLTIAELDEPLVDRLLARRAADDAAEPVVEAVVRDELARWASGQVMTTRSIAGMTRAFSSTCTISGFPPRSRNCLGNGRPMRFPTPPASTTMPIFMDSLLSLRE
jgi:hypothetical protein